MTAYILQELSLAGNELTHLPESIGKLTNLQKLQLSGNYLRALPDSLCTLTALQVIVAVHTAYNVAAVQISVLILT